MRIFFSLFVLAILLHSQLLLPVFAFDAAVTTTPAKSWVKKWKRPRVYQALAIPATADPEATINGYRVAFGLPEFRVNPLLQEASSFHAKYLAENPDSKTLDAHYEIAGKPHFAATDAIERCEKVGFSGICRDVIAWDYPTFQRALQEWMKSPFHRMPLLEKSQGQIGCAENQRWYVCSFSLEDAIEPLPEIKLPLSGQLTERTFRVNEFPPPYPGYEKKDIGPTIMFWPDQAIETIEYGLLNFHSRKPAPVMSISADLSAFTYGAFIFNPVSPLPPNTIFIALVKGTFTDGTSFERKWSFKTGKD